VKVLHVITGLDVGGAERQLAMFLTRTRHDSDVVTMYNPGPVADQIREAGISVHDLGMSKNTQVAAFGALYHYIRAGRYDVVHAHLYRAQIYARPAARLARTPVVVTTEHSIGETHIERRRMTWGVRGLYLTSEAFSDATIAVSDVVVERLVRWGVPARKIRLIPNGVDLDDVVFDPDARRPMRAQFGIDAEAFVIGSLGRLASDKRVDLLIESVAPLLSSRCVLLLVGRGDELTRLQELAASLGVGDYVVFAGYQADTAAVLSAFDLFVTTSQQETFGLSILEALGSGLPVLYTTCPALDGIATERAHRLEGNVSALREGIAREVVAGPRERFIPVEVFERHGMQSVVDQIDDLYEQVLERRPQRRILDVAKRQSESARARSAERGAGPARGEPAAKGDVATDAGCRVQPR
jgi:glycosyltransferase involved in cell wall biosynthesis